MIYSSYRYATILINLNRSRCIKHKTTSDVGFFKLFTPRVQRLSFTQKNERIDSFCPLLVVSYCPTKVVADKYALVH